jgi:hypothetical protein
MAEPRNAYVAEISEDELAVRIYEQIICIKRPSDDPGRCLEILHAEDAKVYRCAARAAILYITDAIANAKRVQ